VKRRKIVLIVSSQKLMASNKVFTRASSSAAASYLATRSAHAASYSRASALFSSVGAWLDEKKSHRTRRGTQTM
jgi:hypothetical protein